MLKLSQPNISEEAIVAVSEVLRSGQLVHGSECEAFEKELSDYLGCREVVLVSSGTAALHVALLALDIGPNDAVIVPDFTFPATANAVVMAGARPVIVDVLPGTYAIDPEQIRICIENWKRPERLRAIMPVHEFGCPADMDVITQLATEHGLLVIEDAACALGAEYRGQKTGTLGDIGCFSFHPRKTLTTGEGGALSTNDPGLARRMRRLRNHGMERSNSGMQFLESSINYRLTNFQAALGRHQLACLDDWIDVRRQLARSYMANLTPLAQKELLTLPDWVDGHSWQTYMIVLNKRYNRNKIITEFRNKQVETNLGAQSLCQIGIYDWQCSSSTGPFLGAYGLALPMFEAMTIADINHVTEILYQLLN